jgi:hypothetical protein
MTAAPPPRRGPPGAAGAGGPVEESSARCELVRSLESRAREGLLAPKPANCASPGSGMGGRLVAKAVRADSGPGPPTADEEPTARGSEGTAAGELDCSG